MRLTKYEGLGNDYLVVEAAVLPRPLDAALVRRLCDRHRGVGSDGILVVEPPRARGVAAVVIWNPDGSQAEKSGNGLRIVARWLHDVGRVGDEPFVLETAGGPVRCRVDGEDLDVDMGAVSFDARVIPVAGAAREVVDEPLELEGRALRITAVTIGNPHCVVVCEDVSEARARALGPLLERHPLFPNRTNVQLARVLDRHAIRLEIWERGAGYTLASGTSSCAAAAACVRLGHCASPVTVHMPGGRLAVRVAADWQVGMTGPAARVYAATLAPAFLAAET
jgi:diaminopimelate epimerase